MATQLSAITMIGTTGQAYADGMRFIQFYFGLPLAMIILSWTLVPFFYNSRVYTVRVSREPFRRKDAKLHQPVVPGVARTAGGRGRFGPGRRPVTGIGLEPDGDVAGHHDAGGGLYDVRRRASRDLDRHQDDVAHRRRSPGDHRDGDSRPAGRRQPCDGLAVAAATGRLRSFDFSFDLTNQHTFWSGTIAALFLFCSYLAPTRVRSSDTSRRVRSTRHASRS